MAAPAKPQTLSQRRSRFRRMTESLDIEPALRHAGLEGLTVSERDQVWDMAVLIRAEIREQLEKAGLTAEYLALKLKEKCDAGELAAVREVLKLRGYYDPLPRRAEEKRKHSANERSKRDRIRDLLDIRAYPVPAEAQGEAEAESYGGGEEGEGRAEEAAGTVGDGDLPGEEEEGTGEVAEAGAATATS